MILMYNTRYCIFVSCILLYNSEINTNTAALCCPRQSLVSIVLFYYYYYLFVFFLNVTATEREEF